MANFGFIIDNRRCIGCHACTVACKSEHEVSVGVNRTWVKYIEKGEFPQSRRLFSVMRCNHCDNAPCVEICPVTALFVRSDGIVDFDNRRCIGCKACMQACPYDALYIDPQTHTAAKCNYCAHRIDKNLEPACVNVCPTQAIISGDLDDPNSRISQLRSRETVTARKVEKGTEPALFYIEGDTASLDPSATERDKYSLWSQQSAGVGHYAKYTEKKAKYTEAKAAPSSADEATYVAQQAQYMDQRAEAATTHPLEQLRNLLDLGDHEDGVLVPDPKDASQQQKADEVKQELARRAYDAPNKGTLWGWQVTGYVWTKAISSGAALVGSFAGLFYPEFVTDITLWFSMVMALVFLAATGYLLTIDLDQPKRFLYVLLRPQWKSWLVRGAYIISVFGGLLALWPVARLLEIGWLEKATLWMLIPASAMTAIYTAFLFAQAKGRDFWQSPLLALHMLIHAVMAGCAVLSLILPFIGTAEWSALLMNILGIALGGKLLIDWFELSMTHATKDAKRAAKMITAGRYRAKYWFGVVLTGCLLPMALVCFRSVALMPVAGLMVLAGLYISEHLWVRAPQQIPLS